MSVAPMPQSFRVPDSLQKQLNDFRRRVWAIKMVEAVFVATVSVLLAFLCIFALDRLWDTPAALRGILFVAAVIGCSAIPYFFRRWIWSHRKLDQVARLLSRKMPATGDALLGVLELARSTGEQQRSPALCQAAISQVAESAAKRDFREATPDSRYPLLGWLSAASLASVVGLGILYPAAAGNAWARLLSPWSSTPRFTFASMEPLPAEMVVAHGEPVQLSVALKPETQWRPATATAKVGAQLPVNASLATDAYAFTLAPQIDPAPLTIGIGDASQTVKLLPTLRPELTTATATVKLPEYLGRNQTIERDVRGGAMSIVKGSEVAVTVQANRDLAAAQADGTPAVIKKDQFQSPFVLVNDSRTFSMEWQDNLGLGGKEPFQLSLAAKDDEAPTVSTEDLPRSRVILDSEQLTFKVRAQDDFGVRQVGIAWRAVPDPDGLTSTGLQPGERVLAAGSAEAERVEALGTFTAKEYNITSQPIEVRVFAEDYYPGRERSYSSPSIFYVLSPEQHAIWMTEQLNKWHRQSLEVRDREMQLYETNKQIRDLPADELDHPDTRRRIETQAAAEDANGRRLAGLSASGAELLKQAARNPELGVGHLEKWAEMLQILQDISGNRMPTVADLLKKSSTAGKSNLAKAGPNAGQNRNPNAAGNPADSDGKEQPPVPTVSDGESSMQPTDPKLAADQQSKKNSTPPSLRLPTTTVMGQANPNAPKPDAQEEMTEAVKEQQDLLAEFEKVAAEMEQLLANMEGSTLVKRLKAASREQTEISKKLISQIDKAFGLKTGLVPKDSREEIKSLAVAEDRSSQTISYIMDDLESYYERRRMVKFKDVLEEMRTENVVGSLRQLSEDIPIEQGLSLAQTEFWADTLDRWAEDLVDPACKGACTGSKSKGSLPPSIVLEVLQILEAEVNLREETRVTEQAKSTQKSEEFQTTAERLSQRQSELKDRVVKVYDRIAELPDALVEFNKELQLMAAVSDVMDDASMILATPETGAPAIAAETDAIELLLQTKRIRPGGGGGGGANPGGGGGGDTDAPAIALIGPGTNSKEVKSENTATQNVGETSSGLPEEFRSGLDEYFNRLEAL